MSWPLGQATSRPTTLYLTGGATAVLLGWRESTIAVDVKIVPEADELLRAMRDLKDELQINIELASPDLFLPVTDDWADRSPWVADEGKLTVRHFDLRAQALAKVERGHEHDLADVAAIIQRGLVAPAALWTYFEAIEAQLYRFPAVDPAGLRASLERAVGSRPPPGAPE